MAVKECAWDGCGALAAYGTRSKPAWCDEHITELLRQGQLEPLEPFTTPTAWRLTRCLTCGCEAHYRFVYTLDKNAEGEATCRACFWSSWATQALALGVTPVGADLHDLETDQARTFAEAHGYDYLGAVQPPAHRVRCRYCARISAERLADVGWGCSCQVNPRRERMAKPAATLLRDSDSAAREWWDHERNPAVLWGTAGERTRLMAWWLCPECGLSFEARVKDMYATARCPECSPRRDAEWSAQRAQERVTPVSTYTELVAAWADDADPSTVMLGDYTRHRFRCANGHELTAFPYSYRLGGCPVCSGQATREANQDARLAAFAEGRELPGRTLNPELVEQWHPTLNGKLRPADLGPASKRRIWWREPSCGHEWMATPAERERRDRLRCPVCRTILDSLAWHYPDLAAEWSPDNPRSAWQVRPSGTLPFVPEWICSTDPSHRWRIGTNVRVHGSTCPLCRESGKSMIELRYFDALRSAFGEAFSGLAMRSEMFARRSVWVPDVTVQLASGRTLLVEYDGSYWHADKTDVDLDKSCDLLAAGVLLVRLREVPLPSLGIDSSDYLEVPVRSTAPDPSSVVRDCCTDR